jgi:tetratricopeptide (TPR) repeat protein
MFAHDKLREQLVEDLPVPARRAVHRAVGEAMERLYADQGGHFAALAHHWREAADVRREARYAREAGMIALQTGACREAVGFLLRARELLLVADGSSPAPRRRRSLRGLIEPNACVDTAGPEFLLGLVEGGLSEAFYRLGDLETCREHSERALRHFGQHVPSSPAGWVAGALRQSALRAIQSVARVRAHDLERARQVAGEAGRVQLRLTDTFFYSLRLSAIVWSSLRVVNQCAPAGPLPELAQGYVILALLAGAARTSRLAEAWGRRALAIAEGTGVERDVAWIRTRRAVYMVGDCRWADGEAEVSRAIAVTERVGDLRLWEEARTLQALMSSFSGRYEQALSLFREALRLSRRTGNRQIECWALVGQGGVLSRLGREEEAARLIEAALGMIGEDVMKAEAICAHGILALVRLRMGDAPGAYESADRAVWHIRSMKPVAYWTQPALAGAAEVLLALREAQWGPTAALRASVELRAAEAVIAMRRFAWHFPLGRPHAALWNGLAAWLAGRRRRAFRCWTRTTALAEQLGTPYERARAHLEIGRHLPLEAADRRHHLYQAEDLLARLGCVTDVARVRDVIALGNAPAEDAPPCS